MNLDYPESINEIEGQRPDNRFIPVYSTRPAKYRLWQKVEFTVNGKTRQGQVTTVLTSVGNNVYHILTPGNVWFRGISEEDISLINTKTTK